MKIWKLKFITKIKKMKKDRCPEYFPIFWLMQWLKKCTIYWDRTQEEGWLWRSVCVCRVCKRGEERYTLFSYRHVNLETCMRCLRTGNIKLALESLSLLFRIGASSVYIQELLVLRNSDIKWSYLRRQAWGEFWTKKWEW